ncbi:MAG: PD-(D/E)XK nuclease family protein [Acidobacteria bacterium]|nr:MAG: PD-(D/E)XK nuclease family protein [Acidobacteriota bacterium]
MPQAPTAGRVPQRRRLIRVPDLATFRRTLAAAAVDGDPDAIRRRALILPSRGAVELLRRSIEDTELSAVDRAVVLPSMFTREDWLADLHASLPNAPRLLSRMEREVLFERATRVAAETAPPPFHVRPGLTAAILDFYDELRRRGRTVARFSSALAEQLAGAEDLDDRGSQALIQQTAFLTSVFEEYERNVSAASDLTGDARSGIDEHLLRARALAAAEPWRIDHIIVAVADHPTDPRGLWPADFDLLGRLPALAAIDIVVTDNTHDAGFRERIDKEVPDLEDVRVAGTPRSPVLRVANGDDARVCTEYRDREEEVRAVARAVRAQAAEAAAPLSRTAVVFQRPLPYLYLAQQVLAEAGVPFQAFDALPLSAEPYAALVDLALVVARTGGTRDSALALARSPLLQFEQGGSAVTLADYAALDRLLIESRVSAPPSGYVAAIADAIARQTRKDDARAARATRAAFAVAALATSLAPFRGAPTGSAQVLAVLNTLRAHERPPIAANRERHLRARSAVHASLAALADAFRRYDDGPREPAALSAMIHHWIERQTFVARRGTTGVHLVDAVAARFGDFDHVHIVGLVDAEWPERQRRSIFYTSGLLNTLGWPGDIDHLTAQQAAFRDLVRLPAETLTLTAFQLEGEAVVAATPLTDEARGLTREAVAPRDVRIFADERLALAPLAADGMTGAPAEWLALRQRRPALSTPEYRGHVGPLAAQEYRVSTLDRYADCPFKYFAGSVLGLDEEPAEEPSLTPRERGTLLHAIFEKFYREWAAAGRRGINTGNLPEAIERFERIANESLDALPEADRVLESARLLGSIVMRGAGERVFLAEVDDKKDVVSRSLEVSLNGTYEFPTGGFGPGKPIAIRGVADRIDELSDGTLRIVDYKLTRAPGDQAVQLKVYGYAAQKRFAKDGREPDVSVGQYISFGDDSNAVTSIAEKNSTVALAVQIGAQQFAQHVTRIEAGEFPPEPADVQLCEWCAFSHVCRRESVTEKGEEGGAAEA